MIYSPVKRLLDIAISAIGLVLLAPLFLVVAAMVRLKLGSPVLFRQERPGLHGVSFEMIKFRSMLAGDAADSERLTSFGRRLRRTSLDELPELLNIFRGDMSLVGPRPLLMHYLPLYDERQQLRHTVRPGLTGLAQVEGRNALDWPTRLELDVRYTETVSLRLDMKILFRTLSTAISGDGVTAEGQATGLSLEDHLASASTNESSSDVAVSRECQAPDAIS